MTSRPLTSNFTPFTPARMDFIRRAREVALDELEKRLLTKGRTRHKAMDASQLLLFSRETKHGSGGA